MKAAVQPRPKSREALCSGLPDGQIYLLWMSAVLLMVALTGSPSRADATIQEPRVGSTFTFYHENDFYTGNDSDYTNGIRLSWFSPDLSAYEEDPRLPGWGRKIVAALPFAEGGEYRKTVSFSMGQNIYTPEDITKTSQDSKDRPYAGITYLGMGFHSRNAHIMNTWELYLGIVGPHSYAENVQKAAHRWTHSDYPLGWEGQLRDEPFANLYYERKWRVPGKPLIGPLESDLIPHGGFAVGNALTAANAGGQVRIGPNLPNDFGTFSIRPGADSNAPVDGSDPRLHTPPGLSVHFFLAINVACVLVNMTLDGNTFRPSRHVDKYPLVVSSAIGIGVIVSKMKITYSYVVTTKEYLTQDRPHSYGSLTVSYTFE